MITLGNSAAIVDSCSVRFLDDTEPIKASGSCSVNHGALELMNRIEKEIGSRARVSTHTSRFLCHAPGFIPRSPCYSSAIIRGRISHGSVNEIQQQC